MSRSVRIVLAVVAAQAVLIGVYKLVEHGRSEDRDSRLDLSTAAPQELEGSVPSLTFRARDGDAVDLRAVKRPTLLHFWATWCAPCRAELPGLLALPDRRPLDVMAVSLDGDWAEVERFLNGRRSGVLLGDAAEVERKLHVRNLPVTFLILPGGRLRLRFEGARDWKDGRFVETWFQGIP